MQKGPVFTSRVARTLGDAFRRKKMLFLLAAVVVIVLAGFYFFGGARKAAGNYITEVVKKGVVSNTIPASGMVEPVSTVNLNFKNAEDIKKIYVKMGDRVTAGQLLAEQDRENLEVQRKQVLANLHSALAKLELLKSGPRQEDVAQAKVNVTMAQANCEQAKLAAERAQKLFQGGAISQAELDKADYDYVNAQAKLQQAEESLKLLLAGNREEDIAQAAAQVEGIQAQLQMAEKELAGTKMTSPINGIVSAINGAEGQRALGSSNTTSSSNGLIVIISEVLQVKAQVNEADIGRLQVGQKAEFTVNAYPDQTFTGWVSSISPQAYTVSNVQIYDAIIQLDEGQQGLKAGMPANVNIIVDRRENVLTVPKGAVTYAAGYLSQARAKEGAGRQASPADKIAQNSHPNNSKMGADPNFASESMNFRRETSSPGGGTGENTGARDGRGAPEKEQALAKAGSQNQQSVVLVLDKAGNPAPRQVVLGISDLRCFEVVEGLNEGEVVVVGFLGPGVSSGAVSGGQSAGMPFMPGGGGVVTRQGGGARR